MAISIFFDALVHVALGLQHGSTFLPILLMILMDRLCRPNKEIESVDPSWSFPVEK